MAFSLTKFRSYGIEADEALNKRNKQLAVFNITAFGTDIDLDIGDYTGTFWTAVGASKPGALKAIKGIQPIADSFLGIRGSSIAGLTQVDGIRDEVLNFTAITPNGGTNNFVTLTVPGLLSTDTVTSVTQSSSADPMENIAVVYVSEHYGGGSEEAEYVVPELGETDTVLAVSQRDPNDNLLPIICVTSYTESTMFVTYASDPGGNGNIAVTVLKPGGGLVLAFDAPGTGTLKAYWPQNVQFGIGVTIAVIRATSTPPANGYTVSMDSTNTQLPNILFASGSAPTSYVLVLEWVLKDNQLPVFYES